MKYAYLFFLTAGILAMATLLVCHGQAMTQTQESVVSATLGGLMMGLQSCIHAVYQDRAERPTEPAAPAQSEKAQWYSV